MGARLPKIETTGENILLEMLECAGKILRIENPIAPSPGPNKACYRIAGVTVGSSVEVVFCAEKVECAKECYFYKLYGICADILATASHLNSTETLVKWVNSDRVRKSIPFGLYHVVKGNDPANAGKKPHGTAVRRGPLVSRQPVTSVVASVSEPTVSPQSFGHKGRKRANEDIIENAIRTSSKPPSHLPAKHRTALWDKVGVQNLSDKLHPGPAEHKIWFVDQCDPKTTKCSGCNGPFRKTVTLRKNQATWYW